MSILSFCPLARGLCLGAALSAAPLASSTLTWDQARQQTLQGNPGLVSAHLAVEAAQQGLALADAGFWPSLNAVAGVNRDQTTALDALPALGLGSGQSSTGAGYSGGVQAAWTLFNGFGTLYARSHGMQQVAQAQAQYGAASAALLLSLHQAFNQLLYDQQNSALLKAIVDRYHQDTLYQQMEFQSGQTARWTFLKSQSDEAQVQWDLEQNGLNTKSDQAALAVLIGRDPESFTEVQVDGDLTVAQAPADDKADWAKALETLPALRLQRAVVAANEASLGQVDAAIYPTLSASGSYMLSGGDTLGPQEAVLAGGLSLSFNLFNGGSNLAGVRQARAVLEGSRNDLANQLLQLRGAVRKAWAAYLAAADRLPSDHLATVAGEERFKTVGALYSAGRAAYLDYEQAETIYTQAEQQELSARLSAAQAQAAYQDQLGLGLEDVQASPAP
jgi:outer membrane protein TolC